MNRYVCELNGQMDLEQAHKHEPTILPAIDKNLSTFYLNLKYTVDPKIIWTLNPHVKCMHVIALHRKVVGFVIKCNDHKNTYTKHYKAVVLQFLFISNNIMWAWVLQW